MFLILCTLRGGGARIMSAECFHEFVGIACTVEIMRRAIVNDAI